MGLIETGLVVIVSSFVTRYVGKIGDTFGGKTLEKVEKLWQLIRQKPTGILPTLKSAETDASNVDFSQVAQELETVANEDQEIRQAVIDVFETAEQEHPKYVKSFKSEVEKIKSEGITAKKINALVQTKIISGGNVGNTGIVGNKTVKIKKATF